MALNTDVAVMQSGATQLSNIKDQTLAALSRYVTINQNLTGVGFIGDAAMASMNSTEGIAATGRQVTADFDEVITMIMRSAQQYAQANADNRATLASIAT